MTRKPRQDILAKLIYQRRFQDLPSEEKEYVENFAKRICNIPITLQPSSTSRYKVKHLVLHHPPKMRLFSYQYYIQSHFRIMGCESKNHTKCRGELWTCERCKRRMCWTEGSTDLEELCDDCWYDIRELGQVWHEA